MVIPLKNIKLRSRCYRGQPITGLISMTRKSTLALCHEPVAQYEKPLAKPLIMCDRNTAGEALSLVLRRATNEKNKY